MAYYKKLLGVGVTKFYIRREVILLAPWWVDCARQRLALESLLKQHRVRNAGIEDILKLCPHLSREQVGDCIADVKKGQMITLAAPAVLMSNTYWPVVYLNHGFLSLNQSECWLNIFPRRMNENIDHLFKKEAVEYSRSHWSKALINGNRFTDSCELNVRNPFACDEYGHPKIQISIYIGMNKKPRNMLNGYFDEAISFMTTDMINGRELIAPGFTSYNRCSSCGGVLGVDHCLGSCDIGYKNLGAYSADNCLIPPLSPKILRYLRLELDYRPQFVM